MIYILIFIVIILCVADFLINHNEKAMMLKKIPGFKSHFLFGNGLEIIVSPTELFRIGRQMANKHKRIYSFYSFFVGTVNIYSPEDIELVISTMKHHEKSELYSLLRPWLRDGLLISNGAKWHQRRKILTSAFHFNVLRQYFPIFEENNQRALKTLEQNAENVVDIASFMSDFTLNSICESAMGTHLNAEESRAGKSYKEAIHDVGKVFFNRFSKMYLLLDFIFYLSKYGRLQTKYLSIMHDFTQKVIKTRKEAIKNKEVNIIEFEDDLEDIQYTSKKKRAAMLDLLIAAQNDGAIDEIGIQEEVDTFMFEGHDTTASGLTFFLLAVANDTDIQEKIVSELRDIFGDKKRATTVEDLNKMQYLECCIKEALRLYPPVHFISRRISETIELSNYTVPEGTFCHIHIFDLHRNPDLFENPLEFNPDRFLPENCASRHNFAYIPFSAGPRNCIVHVDLIKAVNRIRLYVRQAAGNVTGRYIVRGGEFISPKCTSQKFAMMEMKSMLSAIFRNYRVEKITTPSDLVFTADLILRNSEPVLAKFIKREDSF